MSAIPPSSRKPPVVEMVLGLHFKPVAGFDAGVIGEFASQLRQEGDTILIGPAMPVTLEFPPSAREQIETAIATTNATIGRFHIAAADESRAVQVQNGRYCSHWKISATDYPGFEPLLQSFESQITQLSAFLADRLKVVIQPQVCDLHYADHFVRGEWWNEVDELYGLLPGLLGNRPTALPLDALDLTWSYRKAPDTRVDVAMALHRRIRDWKDVAVLTYTATCKSPTLESVIPTARAARAEIWNMFSKAASPAVLETCNKVSNYAH